MNKCPFFMKFSVEMVQRSYFLLVLTSPASNYRASAASSGRIKPTAQGKYQLSQSFQLCIGLL